MEAPKTIYVEWLADLIGDVMPHKTEDADIKYIRADLVEKLNAAHEHYEKLASDEIAELIGLAYAHGWKSSRIEAGEAARKAIEDLLKEIGGE